MASHFLLLALFALVFSHAVASDPSPLQDFCVAEKNSPGTHIVCEWTCLHESKLHYTRTFLLRGLDQPGNTTNKLGFAANLVDAMAIPGLNTLGISLLRLDFALNGLIPPHIHPRATEIFTVVEGTFYVGFVTSNPDNRLFSKVLNKGDVFVFPKGLFTSSLISGRQVALAFQVSAVRILA
uniref:Germin-like protein n=1 Tax=Ananas comosus var. bracteatus TaxID=296719 RepID=A0A6V7PUR8_ANACO|nr:unnamed protein product [Ananas comosus var. bracteatus]